jgi:hypothetical protein
MMSIASPVNSTGRQSIKVYRVVIVVIDLITALGKDRITAVLITRFKS